MIELIISLRSEELTLKDKFLIYVPITLSHEDPTLQKLVTEMLDKFAKKDGDIDITIKAKFTW